MKKPTATFLMTAYNSGLTIRKSIESVLAQTYKNFEFVIVDDASTDNTSEIIKSYNDIRIKYIRNKQNLYIAEAANIGLNMISTSYILRIDSDDICMPQRLERQLSFMEANKDIGVCGSYMRFFGSKNDIWRMPFFDSGIKANMLFNNSLANSSTIIRTEVIKRNNLFYRDLYRYPPMEDYDLWMRLIPFTKFANIKEVLVDKLVSQRSHSEKFLENRRDALNKFFKDQYEKFEINLNEKEIDIVTQLSLNLEYKVNIVSLEDYYNVLDKIMDSVSKISYFDSTEIQKICHKKWLLLAEHISPFQFKRLRRFIQLSRNLSLTNPVNWYIKKKIKQKLTFK